MTRKLAFLVGCNYPGSKNPLNGCVNDVMSMRSMLLEHFGFEESDIVVQVDTDESYTSPTGANIKAALTELFDNCRPGDYVLVHYSGHGTLIPITDHDPNEEETTGYDQAICPTDMNVILDDDLNALIQKCPDGVHLTVICDCCHSGTMLDQPRQQIYGDKEGSVAAQFSRDGLAGMFGLKSVSPEEETVNRGLAPNQFMEMFNMLHGATMDSRNVCALLEQQFGAAGSMKVVGACRKLDSLLASHGDRLGAPEVVKFARGLLGFIAGGSEEHEPQLPPEPPSNAYAPSNVPSKVHLPQDKGILISGCQDMETSADACPSGDPQQAFGALTNAITTVVKAFKSENPDAPITVRQLVMEVREVLAMGGFKQNPCLSCSDSQCDAPFICP